MLEACRLVSDFVDELVPPPSQGSFLDTLAATFGPERRLAPRAQPALQANLPVEEPLLAITVQSAAHLATAQPELQSTGAKDNDKPTLRPRFATMVMRKTLQVRMPCTGSLALACWWSLQESVLASMPAAQGHIRSTGTHPQRAGTSASTVRAESLPLDLCTTGAGVRF
jgi:hypothetical protein